MTKLNIFLLSTSLRLDRARWIPKKALLVSIVLLMLMEACPSTPLHPLESLETLLSPVWDPSSHLPGEMLEEVGSSVVPVILEPAPGKYP
jgi:hypothetical protein